MKSGLGLKPPPPSPLWTKSIHMFFFYFPDWILKYVQIHHGY